MSTNKKALILTFILLPILLFMQACEQTDESTSLHSLFDEAWDYQLSEDPLYATRVGVHDYNDLLPVETEEAYQSRLEKNREFLERLSEINYDELERQDQISFDIFETQLKDRIEEYEFKTYQVPITNRSGFHVNFVQLADRVPLNTVEDYENYISRLNQFQEYSNQHIELMRAGIERGWVLPEPSLADYDATLEPQIVDTPGESRLYEPFENFPRSIAEDHRQRLEEAGREAIMNSVVPGYETFLAFMEEEYVPNARPEIGISTVPDGVAFYEFIVRHYTTLDLTPEEVHQTGLDEVQRIRDEMMGVIEETEFDGTFDEFVHFLRTDPQFYPETKEELLKEVAYALKKIDGAMPEIFKTLPRMPYGIREVPDFIAPRTTTAYYQRPAGDGTRAGFYYVNTYDLSSRPLYEVEALSLHEAVPGHHHQIALQQELDLPDFRRFAGFTVFSEGWGLYSERLGLETGFYEDPYSDFGRLSYEMWRALRLVVDTGMHYLGWTRQEAIDFMAENSALTLHNIRSEVDRYISWPGQAVAYKTGELKIRELREYAENELGENFDVRTFHDAVLLSGAVPLHVLEENIENYIDETRSR